MVSMTDEWIAELDRCRDPERRERLLIELKRDVLELATWLNRAWDWLDRNPEHPAAHDRETRLIDRLRLYERASAVVMREERAAA
jgi:hypothetical protein